MGLSQKYFTRFTRYNQVGYNEMEISPQSTKCINYYPLITNIGYNEGIYRSQALRYNRVHCILYRRMPEVSEFNCVANK